VTIYHGRDVSREFQSNGLTRYRALFEGGQLHLPVNQPFADLLVKGGAPADRVRVHHLGVPVNEYPFSPSRRNNVLRIFSVCRLVEKKGLSIAIAAVAKLASLRPQLRWEYQIAGSGPIEEQLKAQVAEAGLADRVRFSNALPHDEALERIAAADVLLAPSVTAADGDQEGIPITLMEAMALGTIVCSTSHSGIPELIQHGKDGLLAPEHDVDSLYGILVDLLEGRVDRTAIAEAARSTVTAEFNRETQNALLGRLLANTLE
jgi:colanic acid/amylovoran biosynthesis glycosyltransferase